MATIRQKIVVFMAVLLFVFPCRPLEAAPRVILDGKTISFEDVEPFIEKGRVIVPMRQIFEALGAQVEWDNVTRKVTATLGSCTVYLLIGSRTAFTVREAFGKPAVVELDVAPRIVNNRTMIPLRFVSESLNAGVYWDDSTKTVYLSSPVRN